MASSNSMNTTMGCWTRVFFGAPSTVSQVVAGIVRRRGRARIRLVNWRSSCSNCSRWRRRRQRPSKQTPRQSIRTPRKRGRGRGHQRREHNRKRVGVGNWAESAFNGHCGPVWGTPRWRGRSAKRTDYISDASGDECEYGNPIEAAPTQPFGVNYAGWGQPRADANGAGGTTQITVQVQAWDSQSFLYHSNDIALAVRLAMLQSTVLNDVIREI